MLIRFLLFLLRQQQGPIAQLAEHRADNAGVTGAIPVRPMTFRSRRRTERDPERRRCQPGGSEGRPQSKVHPIRSLIENRLAE